MRGVSLETGKPAGVGAHAAVQPSQGSAVSVKMKKGLTRSRAGASHRGPAVRQLSECGSLHSGLRGIGLEKTRFSFSRKGRSNAGTEREDCAKLGMILTSSL